MGELRAGASSKKGAPLNVIGPQIRRLRRQARLSQAALAARCQIAGYDLSRESLAKIEGRARSITDAEILFLAEALRISFAPLFPPPEQIAPALQSFRSANGVE